MARPKKNVVRHTFSIQEGISQQLMKYSQNTGMAQTYIVEKALRDFFEKYAAAYELLANNQESE